MQTLKKQLRTHAKSAKKQNSSVLELELFRRSIRSNEVTDFARQLATMIGARLPLVRSLDILLTQQNNARFKEIIREIKKNVTRGESLSQSLKKYPKVFNQLFVNIVYIGEVSGNLAELMEQLAGYLEKMAALKRKLLTAFSYPAVIVLVAVGAISFLLFGILPTFSEMFAEFGTNMPLPTQMLLNGSQFLKDNLLVVFGCIAGLVLLLRWIAGTKKGRISLHKLQISLPVIGTVIRKVIIARFSRTLGILLRSGISLLEALDVTAKSMTNHHYQQLILRIKRDTAKGLSIEKSIGGSKLFPPMLVQMIAVGEETAELSHMLEKTAGFFEDEVDAAIETLTSIIEPVIIVVLGLVLGGTIIAIYLQIFDLMNVVN